MSRLDKGIFTISLDLELIWGTVDLFGTEAFRSACQLERDQIIDRLLTLFSKYEIPATWCVLGHLFLESCGPRNGHLKHPDVVRPLHDWHKDDWFVHDPGTDETSDPLFYGRSLIRKIRACRVPQEIGSHSFSHVIFGDAGCTYETARSDIKECIKAAAELDIKLDSFAFPRDRIGHVNVLNEFNFKSYRGSIPVWYEKGEDRNILKRAAHLFDVLSAAAPPVGEPEREDGIWNIPGSMIYFPMHGLRRLIPMERRVRRARKGLDQAAAGKKVFHLWFHPTNMAFETEKMFDGLERILTYADKLRKEGQLYIDSMRGIVERIELEG